MKQNTAFTSAEINLLTNQNLFTTKARITQKLSQELLLIEELYTQELIKYEKKLSAEILKSRGKITKGENLKNYPWMVLDYPRVFNRENIFAIRTLVWWGKHISVSLVLSGSYKKLYEETILKEINNKPKHLYICISQTPWEHDFTKDNFLPISKLTSKEVNEIKDRNFLKLSFKIPVKEINALQKKAQEKFNLLLGFLNSN